MRTILLALSLASIVATTARAAGTEPRMTVRTETFARPPYSEATYYVYESDGRTVCTKLSVCNKYDQCRTQYVPGAFREPEDTGASQPDAMTEAVDIEPSSLAKHICLTRFGLAGRR